MELPNEDLTRAWESVIVPNDVKERLVAQSVLALQIRQHIPFERMPIHGLIVLAGPPGTGKTTLARGLASKVDQALPNAKTRFLEVDPHALTSAAFGQSQKEVSKLFHERIPEFAEDRPCVVLLDEVETIAPERQHMSFEANPVDAHRATDAALAGIDALTRNYRNVLLVATTNFKNAVDRALLSRADWIEEIGPPAAEARAAIIGDVLEAFAQSWPGVGKLKSEIGSFVVASEGLDGRGLRKALLAALASSIETAKDPNRVKVQDVLQAIETMTKKLAKSREEAA